MSGVCIFSSCLLAIGECHSSNNPFLKTRNFFSIFRLAMFGHEGFKLAGLWRCLAPQYTLR